MKPTLRLLAAALLAGVSVSSVHAQSDIVIGAPAPQLKVSRWLKGTPVQGYEKGKVYVVEFWATWCGPCIQAMPHLTELSQKYAGKAVFIGVDILETDPLPGKDINKSVDEFMTAGKGTTMGYNVCRDMADDWMNENWMKPANQAGIPCTFVIDRNGNVAWIGHPMSLDKVIDPILDGTFAGSDAGKSFAAQFEQIMSSRRELKPIKDAMVAGKYAVALAEMAKLEAVNPKVSASLRKDRIRALLHTDQEKAFEFIQEQRATDTNKTLYASVWERADEAGYSAKNYALIAELLAEVAPKYPTSGKLINRLAHAYYYSGDRTKAAEIMRKLVETAKANGGEGETASWEAALKKFQTVAAN